MLFAVALILAAGQAAPAYEKRNETTLIGKSRYRVKVREDGSVSVVSKAVLVGRTLRMRDGMRQAVVAVTGCSLVDELWTENTLNGKLDCSRAAPEVQSVNSTATR